MKTAISVPDKLFREADRLAKRLKKSRSRLYSEAIAEYLARCKGEAITANLNEVYASGSQETEDEAAFRRALSRRMLKRNEW